MKNLHFNDVFIDSNLVFRFYQNTTYHVKENKLLYPVLKDFTIITPKVSIRPYVIVSHDTRKIYRNRLWESEFDEFIFIQFEDHTPIYHGFCVHLLNIEISLNVNKIP